MEQLAESEKRSREEETPATSCEATAPTPKKQRVGLNGQAVDRTNYKCVCPEAGCGMKFKYPSLLRGHANIHVPKPPREEWPYECAQEECKKRFLTAHELKAHNKNVHAERQLICKEKDCGKAFATAPGLARHQLVHTEERPAACEEKGCDKSFKSKRDLTAHMLVHSETKPYVCVVVDCDARFKRAKDVASHQRFAHTDARPFKCTVAGCGHDYRYRHGLATHMFTHNDKLPFTCEHEEYACPDSRCRGATFGTTEEFTKHVNDLHDKHPLKAQYISSGGISCTYASTNTSNLASHIESAHNNARSRVDSQRETRLKSALKAVDLRYERNVQISFSCFESDGHYARIDFQVYGRVDGAIVIVEVDQYQHRDRQQYPQACERRRLLDVVSAIQTNERFTGARILWIRYNPDPYKFNDKRVTKSMPSREEALVKVIKDMALPADGRLLTLVYMFYDSVTDPGTSKPQACVLLDDEDVPEMLFDCAIPAIV